MGEGDDDVGEDDGGVGVDRGDDDADESPSPEPRTDSRTALPMKNRRWWRLCWNTPTGSITSNHDRGTHKKLL